MRTKQARRRLAATVVVALAALPAYSSGFSIFEQDAKASAMAGAWVARADNAAANWYNPAAMVRQGPSFQFGFNAITIGRDGKLTLTEDYRGASSGTTFEPESEVVTPAHLYYVNRVGERWAWGFGINTPFGLSTEWNELPITLSARKSELVTFVINPNAAFAIDDHWSVALGVDYIYADIKNFSSDIVPNVTRNLKGDGSDWGFNLAALYDSDDFKVGFSYRSNFSPRIEGNLSINGVDRSPGGTDLNLPDQAAIGFAYTRPEKWELELDVSWAKWSRFDALEIELDNLPDETIVEDWDDTAAVRLGGSFDLTPRQEIRFGILRDANPIPDSRLRPSIPDSDRSSLTLGYGWMGSKIDLDFYYMALFFDNRTVSSNPNDPSVVPGKYELFSHLFGFTFGWRFGGGT